ncbi:hypothetical protein ACP4OV_025349 [Aristida adscensionis]
MASMLVVNNIKASTAVAETVHATPWSRGMDKLIQYNNSTRVEPPSPATALPSCASSTSSSPSTRDCDIFCAGHVTEVVLQHVAVGAGEAVQRSVNNVTCKVHAKYLRKGK